MPLNKLNWLLNKLSNIQIKFNFKSIKYEYYQTFWRINLGSLMTFFTYWDGGRSAGVFGGHLVSPFTMRTAELLSTCNNCNLAEYEHAFSYPLFLYWSSSSR
jgi:hypothetical protein